MFHITSFGDRTRPQYQLIIIGQAKQTTNELNVRSPIGFFNPVIPMVILTSNFTGILSIPKLASILLYNPESRASKSERACWGHLIIVHLFRVYAHRTYAPQWMYKFTRCSEWALNITLNSQGDILFSTHYSFLISKLKRKITIIKSFLGYLSLIRNTCSL